MSEVKDVRAALEKISGCKGHLVNPRHICHHGCPRDPTELEQAFVSEGLAACDRYESVLRPAIIDSWSKMAIQTNGDRVTLLASILRKAGLM